MPVLLGTVEAPNKDTLNVFPLFGGCLLVGGLTQFAISSHVKYTVSI